MLRKVLSSSRLILASGGMQVRVSAVAVGCFTAKFSGGGLVSGLVVEIGFGGLTLTLLHIFMFFDSFDAFQRFDEFLTLFDSC